MSILDQYGIENFYDAAIQNDFARQNLFRVIALGGNRFNDKELLYLTSTSLPGRSIHNIPTPFMGIEFNVPGNASYPNSGNWSVAFRIPQNLSIRRKLEDWTKYTFDDQTSTGSYSTPSRSVDNQVILTLMDKKGNPIRTYTLFGCYCVSIGDITLDVTTKGEIMTTSATLAYQFWRISR